MKRLLFVALLMGTIARPGAADDLYAADREPAEIGAVETLTLRDNDRKKSLDLRITYPQTPGKHPAFIFSHGATGSKDAYQPLVQYWAAHGYVVIQPTHLDSREYGGRISDRASIVRAWLDRVDDVKFIIDSLARIDEHLPGDEPRIDHDNIAVGGHSYGAITSQMIAGMEYILPRGRRLTFADERVKCFVIISPQGTGKALTEDSYEKMTRPMLLITGDNDATPYGDGKGEWRREAFDNAPAGNAWLMWIKDAYHGFGGIAGPVRYRTSGGPNADHVRWVQSMSLAFLDAQFHDDAAAEWLRPTKLREATEGAATIERREDAEPN